MTSIEQTIQTALLVISAILVLVITVRAVKGAILTNTKRNSMKYRIVASCDPYNAKTHYNGQPVLEYEMVTPIKWVIEDDIPSCFEAMERLMRLAKTGKPYENGDWTYEDKESVEEFKKEMLELHGDKMTDEEKETITDWFAGPGIYENHVPVLLEGDTSFRDDCMLYTIE